MQCTKPHVGHNEPSQIRERKQKTKNTNYNKLFNTAELMGWVGVRRKSQHLSKCEIPWKAFVLIEKFKQHFLLNNFSFISSMHHKSNISICIIPIKMDVPGRYPSQSHNFLYNLTLYCITLKTKVLRSGAKRYGSMQPVFMSSFIQPPSYLYILLKVITHGLKGSKH